MELENMPQNRLQRVAHSLPALDISSLGDAIPSEKYVKRRKPARINEMLTYIMSAFYAKMLVILGIALPITDAIATKDYENYDGFYMYLYIGSIVFLLYMYLVQMKEKSFQDSWRNSYYRKSAESTESISVRGRNQHIRYGSFYFRMGVTGFGIGSVIYSGLQFGQYFELSSSTEKDCDNILKALKPLSRIIFALMQMLFIFSYSNFIDVQKSKVIARFGLMHMIATNLCEWLFVLIEETQHDIFRSAKRRLVHAANDNMSLSDVDSQFINSNTFQITNQLYEHKYNCLTTNVMEPILVKSEPYLAPCTVEYSLLCAVILGLMWKNSCGNEPNTESWSDMSQELRERQSGCNVIYSRRQSQFSVDCAQAHKGLFSGILVLAITIISLIMFFELVAYKEYRDSALLQVNVWEAVLFLMGTVAALWCIAALRDVGFVSKRRDLELEHLLLLVTQSGVFMYYLFQIIGGILMGLNKGKGGLMRIVTPFSALIQSSCQTTLVLDAWRRRCTGSQIRRKPGRQLITFLLVANIALWVVNRLKNNRAVSHPNQMDFYGVLAWNIITHVSMPLVVSYRFQSTVCFYEIWKHVYKQRSGNRSDSESKADHWL